MMGNVQQIEQDLNQLEAKLLAIAQELQGTYEDYLTQLGTVARQQVILVSYYLCTQAAPERFLQLSLQQKRKLQQGLKGIARALQEQLLLPLQNRNAEDPEPETDHDAVGNIKAPDSENEIPSRPVVANNQKDSSITITPRELILWHEAIEEHIKHCLRGSSEAANQLLVQYGIVQQPLPEKVLEAAAKAEAASEPIPGPPNLIRVLLDPEGKGAKKKLLQKSLPFICSWRIRNLPVQTSPPDGNGCASCTASYRNSPRPSTPNSRTGRSQRPKGTGGPVGLRMNPDRDISYGNAWGRTITRLETTPRGTER